MFRVGSPLHDLSDFHLATRRHRILIPHLHVSKAQILTESRYPVYPVSLTYYLEANDIKLGDGSVYKTYRDFCIAAVVSIFGPILSSYLVEIHFLGRRRSITLMAWGCSICAGSFTAVETEVQSLALSCMITST